MSLDDFCEQFDIKTDSELSSVGGWIAEQLGEVAEPGDRLTACGLEIVVESVENHFVSAARVRKLPPPPEETEENKSILICGRGNHFPRPQFASYPISGIDCDE